MILVSGSFFFVYVILCLADLRVSLGVPRGRKEDALYVDEKVSAIGAVCCAHQGTRSFIQIQMTS